jgi:hypothetical protein
MSGDFTYVWDAELHGVPETLEQANEMFEHFHAVAREHRTFEKLSKLVAYTRALSDYYKQHDLDRHNRPEFEHIDQGVLIIEEGLTFGSPQHYHAVQLAVAQGLVFFEVDADMAFLPDGRVLPESKQFAWQQHGLRLAQEASKPADQVFPRTEKEFIKKIYNVMQGFISKYGFAGKEYFYIFKKTDFGELKGGVDISINSIGTTISIYFSGTFSSVMPGIDIQNYWNKAPRIAHVEIVDLLRHGFEGKFSGVSFSNNAHSICIENKNLSFLENFLQLLPVTFSYYYYRLQDMVWVNQLVNHNNFHYGTVNAHPDLRLILAAVHNDPCFDQIVEEGRKDKVRFFLKHKENPCPDEAAAEQKYAEYVEYVRNMKTVPWQLEEIPPEYQVKRPEGLLLVHELDVKLKENEVYNTGFLLASNDPMQVILKFITTDGGEAGVSVKGAPDGVNITFENWAYISEFELPQPQVLGKTDDGRDFCMSYQIKTSHQLNSHRHINSEEQALSVSSLTTMSTTYQLLWQMFVAR